MSAPTAPTYKPSEGKREEFRKYLEKTGVMDALTKVLVNLYEESEKPEDALAYLRNKLATQSGCETLETVKAQLEEANAKIAALENENMALKSGDVKETSEEVGEPVPEVDEPLDEVTGSVTEATSEAPAPPPE